MEDYQLRVVEEKSALDEKLQKLELFIGSDVYNGLSPDDQWLLISQRVHMKNYSDVLGHRIAAFPQSVVEAPKLIDETEFAQTTSPVVVVDSAVDAVTEPVIDSAPSGEGTVSE